MGPKIERTTSLEIQTPGGPSDLNEGSKYTDNPLKRRNQELLIERHKISHEERRHNHK